MDMIVDMMNRKLILDLLFDVLVVGKGGFGGGNWKIRDLRAESTKLTWQCQHLN